MTPEPANAETILVVEDEPEILSLVAGILNSAGFKVLTAGSGDEGLQHCRQHEGKIDLLLTDIVMPGMSGGELFRQLQTQQPEIRVLFMSGYTKYTVVSHGVLESVSSFIWKPFSPKQLLEKVRQVIDSPRESQ